MNLCQCNNVLRVSNGKLPGYGGNRYEQNTNLISKAIIIVIENWSKQLNSENESIKANNYYEWKGPILLQQKFNIEEMEFLSSGHRMIDAAGKVGNLKRRQFQTATYIY